MTREALAARWGAAPALVSVKAAQSASRRRALALKRALDLALVIPAGILALPFILLAAVAILLASPGPVFYAQSRRGLDGVAFRMWKLRTMRPDADAVLARLLRAQPALVAEWEGSSKLRHDPRIIPVVGHFLRRYSIDELPQLLNVLRGDMSMVGPRPLPDYHLARLRPGAVRRRCRMRPGITGQWQVSGRSTTDDATLERADALYVRHWSLGLDILILLRTIPVVLRGTGAW
ncbi:sugar transferase [Roseomonas stagni]|uniref:Sugar transferase n=1 Tax=Falsiroseomonas algicola TaxID=2716930 RepID=A0A6M1LW69_9PROT|nr:sugar transferase [Falsiroseomonas algicola]NGM24212.1 sugar transferase [Falsiroseomonas algicola]